MERPKIYVLDTNVLIHDPNSVYNFEEHDIMIPMVVLEELDKLKVGPSAVAADCRQAVRTIDNIIGASTPREIAEGVLIKKYEDDAEIVQGRLSILMSGFEHHGHKLTSQINDNQIINDVLNFQKRIPDKDVILITKDINMRLKARGCGLSAEDYHNDQLITDIDRLTTGYHRIDGSFWEQLDAIQSQTLTGEQFHTLPKALLSQLLGSKFFINQFILDEKEFVGRIKAVDEEWVTLELLNTGLLMRQKCWGLNPRDIFQAMAMYLIMDPEIDLVSLNGPAGSGKTILALACALELTLEQKSFKRIIATRSTRGLDEDIGFLPGTETEKMTPWLGAFTDNLEALHAEDYDPSGSEHYVGSNMPIHFKSLNFVRGRSFQNSFLIVDEAQNLTPHQIKTIITRAGEGTKVLCMGNLAQIDTPYLGATSSGLTYMSERFKGFDHGGSITLKGVARSRLAAYAEKYL
ncbi:PhoH family protein [Gynuella sunshinyii]|uniref:Putative ATPase-like phosphate starvation-inducible protein PhoH n=1 Tax=Gynuella sunshinyii YC6258 TaxID=1445510 RepID=A0A0C5VZI2_9GAMM|nr:PhoH family protein [Gynuella sunshinyii]AJQ95824.1 putative ATPase-like phosphate starvation-inducible protein PhoH [Gynuella sunshinyii YC6258]